MIPKGIWLCVCVLSCPPAICVGRFHLYDPATKKAAPEALLAEMAHALREYRDTRFYTCNCTGQKGVSIPGAANAEPVLPILRRGLKTPGTPRCSAAPCRTIPIA